MRRVDRVVLLCVAGLAPVSRNQPRRPPSAFAPEARRSRSLAATRRSCARPSLSRREPAEALREQGFFLFPERPAPRRHLRRRTAERKLVRMAHGRVTEPRSSTAIRAASFTRKDHDGIFFTPVPVKTTLPDAASQPWPMGDAPSRDRGGRSRSRRHRGRRRSRVSDPAALTAAVVVVYKGHRRPGATLWESRRTRSSRAGRWARASLPHLRDACQRRVFRVTSGAGPDCRSRRPAARDPHRGLLHMSSG